MFSCVKVFICRPLLRSQTMSSTMCPNCGFECVARIRKPKENKRLTMDSGALVSPILSKDNNQTGFDNINLQSKEHRALRSALFTPRATPAEMYILDEELADKVADFMKISPDDDCIILESNPGLGTVTKKLLERGAKRIRLLEGREIFAPHLASLQQQYPTIDFVCPLNVMDFRSRRKMQKKPENPNGVGSITDIPEETKSRHEKLETSLISGFPTHDWNSPTPSLKFFGVVPERSEMFFLRRVLNSVAKKILFSKIGRPEFFLILSPRQRYVITLQPGSDTNLRHYRWATVAFQTLFDLDTLHEIPRSFLLPPMPAKLQMSGSWYLVRLTARQEIALNVDWSLLPEFIFFVNQAMTSRTRPLIAWIEGWIPGYGRKLLDMGFTLYEKTGDLGAMQYLELFKSISESDDYRTSNLKTAFTVSPDAAFHSIHEEDPEELAEDKDLVMM